MHRYVPDAGQIGFNRYTILNLHEIDGLHEGNIARHRLRPAELRAWREAQDA